MLLGVSLDVGEGEVAVIVGSNGAGKSTTLACVAGLHVPSSGRIAVDGVRIQGKAAEDLVHAGMMLVPQGRRVFGELSVIENLRVGGWARRKEGGAFSRAARLVFELFPVLAERRQRQAGSLGAAEQQKLAIGRALMALPRLLLVDEPSLGLPPQEAREILDAVARLPREGVTVLLAEQHTRALAVCDRAFVMEQGRLAPERWQRPAPALPER